MSIFLVAPPESANVEVPSGRRQEDLPGSGREGTDLDVPGDVAVGRANVTESSDSGPTLRRWVYGRVVAASTGEAVRAQVRMETVSSWSSAASGDFALPLPIESAPAGEVRLQVEAEGFLPAAVSVSPVGERDVTIVLSPRASIHGIVVGAEGRALPGAEVVDGSSAPSARAADVVAVADAAGEFSFEAGDPRVLVASHRRAASLPLLAVPGGERVELRVLEASNGHLGLRSQDGEPVADVPVELLRDTPLWTARLSGCTTEAGVVCPSLPAGNYRVRVTRPRLRLAPDSHGNVPGSVAVEAGEIAWLDLDETPPYPVAIVDGRTGAVVRAPMAWLETRHDSSGWSAVGSPVSPEPIEVESGTFALGTLPLAGYGEPTALRIGVAAEAYAATYVEEPLLRLPMDGAPTPIRLRPAASRKLRVLDGRGFPYPRRIRLTDGTGRTLLRGRPDTEGLVGPIGESAGDWLVYQGYGPAGSAAATVFAATRAQSEVPTVRLDASCELRVTGLPEGYHQELFCRDDGGSVYGGASVNGAFVFPALPPGRYEVGPQPTMATSSLRRHHGGRVDRTELRSGQSIEVRFREEWAPVPALGGRLELSGIAAADLFAAPLFEPHGGPILGGKAHRRFAVSESGAWSLEDLEMAPTAVLIGTLGNGGDEVPLAVVDPESTAVIDCVRVDLCGADPGEPYFVQYSPPLPHPWRTAAFVQHWGTADASGVIRLDAVPVELATLGAFVGDSRHELSLDLEPHRAAVVQLP